ncbi:P protein-like [Crassostrea angulata]|uniref:P protein-like n=1 Tax=Magallana angulata TaxID=2784310 RepID=UPI0022B1B8D8|nr:P protein-like [Crassostrea angulata]XP_052675565.1 P protein-like [Crassostrea angulata]
MTSEKSTSDLQTLLHYNRPKSTPPAANLTSKEESTFGGPFRASSVVPFDSRASDERTPLIGVVRGQSETFSQNEEEDEEETFDKQSLRDYFSWKNKWTILNHIKIAVLLIITSVCCIGIMMKEEIKTEHWHQVSVDNKIQYQEFDSHNNPVKLLLKGPIKENINGSLRVTFGDKSKNDTWKLEVDDVMLNSGDAAEIEHKFDKSAESKESIAFELSSNLSVVLLWKGEELPTAEIVYAAIILLFVYILIIFELVHRTLAAILGSLAAIAALSLFDKRPELGTIISWIDMETLMLLFGMMVIVSIFSETGFFDSCALQAYKLAKGKVWPLITLLCVFSAVVSAFLDNVTTILLLAPVTIRLCEVLNLDPKNILIAEVLFSNIGGTATAIGDPPNVIIVSNSDMKDKGIDFATFTGHMCVGIIFVGFVGYGALRLLYRDINKLQNQDPPEIAELKHEIELWRRAAARVSVVSREESIMKALFQQKAVQRENALIKQLYRMRRTEKKDFQQNVRELERKYYITDRWLLVKTGLVLAGVILCFFLHSFINGMHIDLGWIAVIGAIFLLVVADIKEMENILHRVEWATLIFFAALFVLMEALTELQLIDWINTQVTDWIRGLEDDKKQQLAVAILLILWVSAIASSFIDNIPYTTAMIPVLLQISESENIPLQPLTFALAFGACLGGNGTLIGASANVVCAGIAEQHGYGFSFKEFFKVGFPLMLVTTVIAMFYLLICHVAFKWHPD